MGRALSVIGVPTGPAEYSAALEGLTALDEYQLRANPGTPRLYDAGIRYTKEVTGEWRDVKKVLASGSGDCEALSTWRAAELRVSGEDPNASVVVYKTGATKYHAIVLRGDGTLEDPSVELGMKPPEGLVDAYDKWNTAVAAAPKQEEKAMVMGTGDDVACAVIGANPEPHVEEIVFDVVGTDDGHKGVLRIPLTDGRAIFASTSTAATEKEAAAKAHRVLGVIGSVWDDLAYFVPGGPQAQAALRLARNEHVQNLAKAAYQAGSRAVHKGADVVAPRRPMGMRPPVEAAQPDDVGPDVGPDFDDNGQGYADAPGMATDVMGDLVEVNGVLCGADELATLGAVNEALARGSIPRTIVGRASRGGGGKARGGGGGGKARGGGGGGKARGGGGAQQRGGGGAQQRGGGGAQQRGGGGAQQRGGGPGFGPPSGMPYGSTQPGGGDQGARAAYLAQQAKNAAADQMLQQSGGSGGGGGGGGDGAFDGGSGSNTAADQAAAEQADADLFSAYYGQQAFNEGQEAYFNTAEEASPDQFFGYVDPLAAEAMLADESIPAQ